MLVGCFGGWIRFRGERVAGGAQMQLKVLMERLIGRIGTPERTALITSVGSPIQLKHN